MAAIARVSFLVLVSFDVIDLYQKFNWLRPVVLSWFYPKGHDRYYNSVEAEDWVQIRDCTTFGFGLLNVRNQSHAKWQWIKNIDEGRVDVHDEGYILNQIYL